MRQSTLAGFIFWIVFNFGAGILNINSTWIEARAIGYANFIVAGLLLISLVIDFYKKRT